MSLRDEFPGLKIITTPAGLLAKCTCYMPSRSGARRSKFKGTIPEIREWFETHDHGMTEKQAWREVHRMSRERHRAEDRKILEESPDLAAALGITPESIEAKWGEWKP